MDVPKAIEPQHTLRPQRSFVRVEVERMLFCAPARALQVRRAASLDTGRVSNDANDASITHQQTQVHCRCACCAERASRTASPAERSRAAGSPPPTRMTPTGRRCWPSQPRQRCAGASTGAFQPPGRSCAASSLCARQIKRKIGHLKGDLLALQEQQLEALNPKARGAPLRSSAGAGCVCKRARPAMRFGGHQP